MLAAVAKKDYHVDLLACLSRRRLRVEMRMSLSKRCMSCTLI